MDEKDFGRKVCSILDSSVNEMDESVKARLALARRNALEAAKGTSVVKTGRNSLALSGWGIKVGVSALMALLAAAGVYLAQEECRTYAPCASVLESIYSPSNAPVVQSDD